MALQFCDSFEHYAIGDILKKWTAFTGGAGNAALGSDSSAPGATVGLGQYYTNNNVNTVLYKTVSPVITAATGGIGFWMYIPTGATTGAFRVAFMDGATEQCGLMYNASNILAFERAGGAVLNGPATIPLNTWVWVEIKVTINNSTGVYEVKINGQSYIAQQTAQNTRNSANNFFTGVGIVQVTNTGSTLIRVKGLVLWDSSGTVCNDFIGPCVVSCLRPAGVGNYAQWTPNSGANHGAVRELFGDGDTSFNASSTVNQIDTFDYTNLPAAAGSILGLQHVIMARQDSGAGRTVAPLARISGTDYAGTALAMSAGHLYYPSCLSLSPATSAAWTVSEVNAAEYGYKLVS